MAEAHSGQRAAPADIGALRELKRAEAKAREAKAAAQSLAKGTVDDAVGRARAVRSDAEESGRASYEAAMRAAKEAAQAEGAKSIAKGQSEADGIRKNAAGDQSKQAVDRVIAEFKKLAGGT